MKILTIIIVNYRTAETTLKCISSLVKIYSRELKSSEYEIVLVDNGSKDNSMRIFKNYLKEHPNVFKVVENSFDVGFGGGANFGAKFAKGKYLLFLNPDTIALDHGIPEMVGILETDKRVGIVGGRLINTDHTAQKTVGRFPDMYTVFANLFGLESKIFSRSPKKIKEVDWVCGGCFMISKKVFSTLRGFDEDIFMYMEDVEICLRVRKMGYKIIFFPYIKMTHIKGGSSNFAFMIINVYKSKLYYFRKHKSKSQYLFIKKLFFIKAYLYYLVGRISHNDFLKDTYEEVYKIYQ